MELVARVDALRTDIKLCTTFSFSKNGKGLEKSKAASVLSTSLDSAPLGTNWVFGEKMCEERGVGEGVELGLLL